MCGIYGFFGRAPKKKRRKLAELLLKLAYATLVRGRDSTGFYARSEEHEFYEKNAVDAKVFYKESELFIEAVKTSYMFVGHNRAASVGAVETINAHPFIADNWAAVVNGTFSKVFDLMSDEAFDKMEGETDSEAIILELDRKPEIDKKFLKKLNVYSMVIADRNKDRLYFARDPERPMVIADMRSTLGVRIFASTGSILEAALAKSGFDPDNIDYFYTKSYCLYEGDVESGEVNNVGRYRKAPPAPKENKGTGQLNQNRKPQPGFWSGNGGSLDANDPGNYHFVKTAVDRAMAVFGD